MTLFPEAAKAIHQFQKNSLTNQIAAIEYELINKNQNDIMPIISSHNVTPTLLESAITIKRTVGQINVLIHAIGILLALPKILEEDEVVEYLSLGAGNTGRPFDLETNHRIAEFKFINWHGGPETIRQNSLFKDFYLLAENPTAKQKYLFVVGLDYPMKFFRGGRALNSVFSRNRKLWTEFEERYQGRFQRVCEYYEYREEEVKLVDISRIIPEFISQPENYEEVNEEG